MTIKEIHNLFTKMGMEADFRGAQGVQKLLDHKKARFQKLSLKEQNEFDKEALENPYLDSGVYNVSDDKEIKKVLVGIDIGPEEILVAKQLGDIDLVIAHHPIGKGLAQLADVMDLQCDVYNFYGVPINVAEGLMRERISEVARGVNSSNHQRTVDTARILGVNLMNSHTSSDNMAAKFLRNFIENNPSTGSGQAKFERVGEIIEALKEIPEYKEAMKIGVGPKIFVGSPDHRCGKIALTEITGGTEGSPLLYEKVAQAGIGTVIGMHISEEHKKQAQAANINIIIAGHMSSDSLGMNLLMDELQKKGIEIVPCSGFTRFSRA
ncbi:MAG: NGG1p interacting factor NIF3 [Candidatus Staskawiczbacteria bacterium RIFCSPHIGHO2_02_FULL_34_10]|uniref:NGG1p interacting factor NIF3 n=1 Tax=Candidatus Staskawiczbacteria bacterium RIFCSPHIGHO2_02_FULL_34_10 TaxID=1802205 RepID=A0A1G2HZ98_9BACT|nr:MAG: NGG1p interacting factor NIF3 [Candidatus Staskawiczbacteria bacterium RIFCSPHIGHO2_02_FULL_34_10]